MSESEQSHPARPHSTVTTPTLGDHDKLRSDLVKLVDRYDAIAHELRRKDIPVKKSWATNQAVANARLDRMVSLHERANNEQLNLVLGESKLSAEQIRHLRTEVDSLAALLFTGMEDLKTDISEMDAAAAAGAAAAALVMPPPRETASCPVKCRNIPVLHPGSAATSAHSAESAPAWAARQLQINPRLAAALDGRLLQRQTEKMANAAARSAASAAKDAEAAELDPVAPGPRPGHGEEDCVATIADYSDWTLTPRLINELVPDVTRRAIKTLLFVEWAIKHMAKEGPKKPFINGTGNCGGYTKKGLVDTYRLANPEAPEISDSVFNNQQAPAMRKLWNIARELVTNTRKHLSGDSGTEVRANTTVRASSPQRRRNRGNNNRRRRSSPSDSSSEAGSARVP